MVARKGGTIMIIQTETRARNERSLGKKTEEKNETKSRRIRSKLCKNSVRFSREDSRAAPRNYKNQWDLLSSFWRRSPKTAKLIRDSAWTKKGRVAVNAVAWQGSLDIVERARPKANTKGASRTFKKNLFATAISRRGRRHRLGPPLPSLDEWRW